MARDLYDAERCLASCLRRLEADPQVTPRNKELILRFRDDCLAHGIGTLRVIRLVYDLRQLGRWLGRDFDGAGIDDIKAVVACLERTAFTEWTKIGYRTTLKKFYKWVRGTAAYPPEVAWLRTRHGRAARTLPEDLLDEAAIMRLIEAAVDPRDKALVAVLYESGCRVGELLGMQLKHLAHDALGVQVRVTGKTGSRRVRLVAAVPHLLTWLRVHPRRHDDAAYVWVTRAGSPIGYGTCCRILTRLARRAGVQARVNPHTFRHSRATFLANHLTEAQMKEHFGWLQSSEMAAVYVHLSGRDVDGALMKLYGVSTGEISKPPTVLTPRMCGRCTEANASENRFCQRCGMVLDPAEAARLGADADARRRADDALDRLLQDEEFRALLSRKIRGLAPESQRHR